MQKSRTIVNTNNGFTLIELMVAIVVLGIGFTALVLMQTTSTGSNARGRAITGSAAVAADHLETLMSLPYDHNWLIDDPTGSGNFLGTAGLRCPLPPLPPDPLAYGVGDPREDIPDPANFPADFTIITPDGNFTIYWNIALDYPIVPPAGNTTSRTKTVKVVVISTGLGPQKMVTLETSIPLIQ
jgi:prepilin-type N-terminal cleavage/methylation domain-containing protein